MENEREKQALTKEFYGKELEKRDRAIERKEKEVEKYRGLAEGVLERLGEIIERVNAQGRNDGAGQSGSLNEATGFGDKSGSGREFQGKQNKGGAIKERAARQTRSRAITDTSGDEGLRGEARRTDGEGEWTRVQRKKTFAEALGVTNKKGGGTKGGVENTS